MKEKTKTNTAQGATPATKKPTNHRHEVKCCFCGRTIQRPAGDKTDSPYYLGTNNPWPYFDGDETRRCCDACHEWIVQPARMRGDTPEDASRQVEVIELMRKLIAAARANFNARKH
jgi:hypothetical protein